MQLRCRGALPYRQRGTLKKNERPVSPPVAKNPIYSTKALTVGVRRRYHTVLISTNHTSR